MSLYNMLFGTNPFAGLLKEILELDMPNDIKFPESWQPYDEGYTEAGKKYVQDCIKNKVYPTGRFRDMHLAKDEKGNTIISLFTRNGGGNRDEYFYIFDILKTHPNYIRDYDDDFDCTYAYIEFSVPDKHKNFVEFLLGLAKDQTAPMDKFNKLMDNMDKKNMNDPAVKKMMEVGKSIVEGIEKMKEGKGGGVIEL